MRWDGFFRRVSSVDLGAAPRVCLVEGVWDKKTTFATMTVKIMVNKQPRMHLVGKSRETEVVRRRFFDTGIIMVCVPHFCGCRAGME